MAKDDVLLVAGNLVSVSTDVSEIWRKEVVNSILFSQLYASSKLDKFASSQQWCKYYAEAMEKLKWKAGVWRLTNIELNEGVSIVLNRLIKDRFGLLVKLLQLEQFERLMYSVQQGCATEAIASSTGEHAMVRRIEGDASTVSTVALHVSLVGRGPAIYSAFIYFDTSQEVESDFFTQEFKSELIKGEVGIAVSCLVLDKAGYEKARIREKVLGSLPEVTTGLVLDINAECDVHER
jgi:hypothetical protein